MAKSARKRSKRSAIVPKVVLSLGLAGVVPLVGACSNGSPVLSVAAALDMRPFDQAKADQPVFTVAAIFDMVMPQPDVPIFTVAAIFDMATPPDMTPDQTGPFTVAAIFDMATGGATKG